MSENSNSNDDDSSFTSIIEDAAAQMMQNIPEQAAPPSSPVQSSSPLPGTSNLTSTFPGPFGLFPPGSASLRNFEGPSLLLAPRTLTPSLRRYEPEQDYVANSHTLHFINHAEPIIGTSSTSRTDIIPNLQDEPAPLPTRDQASPSGDDPTIPPTSPIFNPLPLPPTFPTNEQGAPESADDQPRTAPNTVERLLEMMRTLSIQDPEEDGNEEDPPSPVERRWRGTGWFLRSPENPFPAADDNLVERPLPIPRAHNPNRGLQERAQTIIEKLETLDHDLVQRFCALGCAGGEEGDRCTICWESFVEVPESASKGEEGKEDEERVVSLPCAHIFHSSCLKQWFITPSTTCPVCRFEMDPLHLLAGGGPASYFARGGGRLVRMDRVSPTGDTFPETTWVDDVDVNRRRVEVEEEEYEAENDWTDEDDWTDEEDDFLTEDEEDRPFLLPREIYRVPIEGEDEDEEAPQLEEVIRTDYRERGVEEESGDETTDDDSVPDLEGHTRSNYQGQDVIENQASIEASTISTQESVPPALTSTSRENPERVTIEIVDSSPSTSRSASPVQPAVFEWVEELAGVNEWESRAELRSSPVRQSGIRIIYDFDASSSVAAERSSSPSLSPRLSPSTSPGPLSLQSESSSRFVSDSREILLSMSPGRSNSSLQQPDSPRTGQRANEPALSTSETDRAVTSAETEAEWGSLSGFLSVPQSNRSLLSGMIRPRDLSPEVISALTLHDPIEPSSSITRAEGPATSVADGTIEGQGEAGSGFSFASQSRRNIYPITRWPSPVPMESRRQDSATTISGWSISSSPMLGVPASGVLPGLPFGADDATRAEGRRWTSGWAARGVRREWRVPNGVVDEAGGVRAWITKREKELSEERQS
jgi:hypothetical protein